MEGVFSFIEGPSILVNMILYGLGSSIGAKVD
jgi:hypothetical protein